MSETDLLGMPITPEADTPEQDDEPGFGFAPPAPPAKTPVQKTESAAAEPYRVLARKYRPRDFSQLIGQEALVRTLTNAIESGRIAHAFMLTGVRGVGKTTSARIVARALNCIGVDGNGGATPTPCGVCANCVAIAADRHMDVLELDAASKNSVADIRELTDGARYAPVSARYKIYIIDEVHMLSMAAFNALLKTLEEPPAHAKFIFATTEIRKVPVTVLSRCQRFDLRRVDADILVTHFQGICNAENVTIDDDALRLIARAADGSVRDGLSLLDQAIARNHTGVTGEDVRDMLGLADRAVVFDLFSTIMQGKSAEMLEITARLHASGADAAIIIQDLLDLTHALSTVKAAPKSAERGAWPKAERQRAESLAASLSVANLTRCWQILLKGLAEVQSAPVPHQAAEMVLLRLLHASELPDPAALIRTLQAGMASGGSSPRNGGGGNGGGNGGGARLSMVAGGAPYSDTVAAIGQPAPSITPLPAQFSELVALIATHDAALAELMRVQVKPVSYHPHAATPRLDIALSPMAQPNMPGRIMAAIQAASGQRLMVMLSNATAGQSLAEVAKSEQAAAFDAAYKHPMVLALMQAFEGLKLEDVRNIAPAAALASPTSTGYNADTESDHPEQDYLEETQETEE